MKKTVFLACFLAASPLLARNDDLQKQINTLTETNKLILQELQAIRKVLEQQRVVQAAPQQPADVLPADPIDVSRDPFRGAANARIAIIEYSDYQCPFCERFEKDAYLQIQKEFVDTGKVKYVWRDMPLDMHQYAAKAAEAGNCAGAQGKFWEMHDRLFANKQALTPADLTKHAEALQLNVGQFQTCLDSGRYAADVKADMAEAAKAGISGTPSFLFGVVQPNGTIKVTKKIVGSRAYADYKAAIEGLMPAGGGAGTK